MLSSDRIVRLSRTRSIKCYECGEEKGVWWFMASLLSSKRGRGKSMWVSPPPPLSLSLSLRVRVLVCGVICLHLIWLCCREICLPYRFSHLIESNWVFFVFYREVYELVEKLILIIFIFWQISSTFRYALILCAEVPFSILKKVDNIRWMLSWVLVAIIILCVR